MKRMTALRRRSGRRRSTSRRSRNSPVVSGRAEEKVVLEFLPVLDNLERALVHAEAEPTSLIEGVRMVQKQFVGTLDRFEVRSFDSIDSPFDPERHEAIQQMPSDKAAGVVCLVLQKGYVRGERLVRAALVGVSTGSPGGRGEGKEATEPSPSAGDA